MTKRILLAGCGDLGTELGLRLVTEGHEVWGLRRNTEHLPASFHGWSADLSDASTLQSPPADFTHIVYTATPGAYEEAAYQRTYVQGVRNLLSALKGQTPTPERFVLSSSTSVYHQKAGEWVDETTSIAPTHFSGLANHEGEQLVSDAGIPSVVVRFGGIYGPGRTRLLKRVAAGQAQCVQGQTLYSNRIHRDDCVGILQHFLFHPDPPSLVNGVDTQPATMCEVYRCIAGFLGVEPPPTVRPEEAARVPRSSKRIRNQRLLDSGYNFAYPTFEQGYKTLVEEWLQEQEEL